MDQTRIFALTDQDWDERSLKVDRPDGTTASVTQLKCPGVVQLDDMTMMISGAAIITIIDDPDPPVTIRAELSR